MAADPPDSSASPDLPSFWADAYDDLKVLARTRIRSLGDMTLLDTTALVHDSYLRILNADTRRPEPGERRMFFAYASSVMRSVIVDIARERLSEKRGGGEVLRFDTRLLEPSALPGDDDPLFVNDAIEQLRKREPRLAQVVEMRFFGGLTEPEIAELLDLSERTIRADWQKARALMRMLMS